MTIRYFWNFTVVWIWHLLFSFTFTVQQKQIVHRKFVHMAYSFQLKLYIESFSWIIEVFYKDSERDFGKESAIIFCWVNLDFIVTKYILEHRLAHWKSIQTHYVGSNGSSSPWFDTYPFFLLFEKIMFWKKMQVWDHDPIIRPFFGT